MVTGLDLFKERFAKFTSNYVLIGGAACYIYEDINAQVPRATKDLDIILVVEVLAPEFGNDRVGNGAEVGIVDKGEFIRRYEDPQASFLNYLYQR